MADQRLAAEKNGGNRRIWAELGNRALTAITVLAVIATLMLVVLAALVGLDPREQSMTQHTPVERALVCIDRSIFAAAIAKYPIGARRRCRCLFSTV